MEDSNLPKKVTGNEVATVSNTGFLVKDSATQECSAGTCLDQLLAGLLQLNIVAQATAVACLALQQTYQEIHCTHMYQAAA